jgi:hypothetical protein
MAGGAALALVLPGCIPGPGECIDDPTWVALLSVPPDLLVNRDARPTVEGRITVGSSHELELEVDADYPYCGGELQVTWHASDPDVARIEGGRTARLTAIAPGHIRISATVVDGKKTSEAPLVWCQPDRDGRQTPRRVCTYIPMNGVQVVP